MDKTSSNDDHQEQHMHMGYRAETTLCDSQDSPCRMATNTEPCGLHLHSSQEVRKDVQIAQSENKSLTSL